MDLVETGCEDVKDLSGSGVVQERADGNAVMSPSVP